MTHDEAVSSVWEKSVYEADCVGEKAVWAQWFGFDGLDQFGGRGSVRGRSGFTRRQ